MYHFIGIKGAGMSSLAVIMKQLPYKTYQKYIYWLAKENASKELADTVPVFFLNPTLFLVKLHSFHCLKRSN